MVKICKATCESDVIQAVREITDQLCLYSKHTKDSYPSMVLYFTGYDSTGDEEDEEEKARWEGVDIDEFFKDVDWDEEDCEDDDDDDDDDGDDVWEEESDDEGYYDSTFQLGFPVAESRITLNKIVRIIANIILETYKSGLVLKSFQPYVKIEMNMTGPEDVVKKMRERAYRFTKGFRTNHIIGEYTFSINFVSVK